MAHEITHSLVKRLASVPSLSGLDDRTLLRLVGASTNLFWRDGGSIFKVGDVAEALYIVLSGCVEITTADGEHVDTIEKGEFFGERALMLNCVHSKAALATEDTELMVVRRDFFDALLLTDPVLADHFRVAFESST